MLRILAVLVLYGCCGTEGFLIGTTHSWMTGAFSGTTPIPRYPTSTGPDDCDVDKLLNCTNALTNEFNLTNPGAVDPDLLYEFTCGPRGSALLACFRESFKHNCSVDNSGIMQSVMSLLPDVDTVAATCQQTNKTTFGALQRCMVSYSQNESFSYCINHATGGNTSDMCRVVQTSLDCSYKYVDLVCPHLLPDFLTLSRSQYNAQGLGDCNITVGAGPTATSCDAMMQTICTMEVTGVDSFVDTVCRPDNVGGRCWRKVNSMCDPDNYLTSNEILDMGCLDKTGFGQFVQCSNTHFMASGASDCMHKGFNFTTDPSASTTETSWCTGFYTAVSCYTTMIQSSCPSVMPFYQHMNEQVEHRTNCSAIVTMETNGTTPAPNSQRRFTTVAPMMASTPQSSIGSVQKSILLQMALHLQHQAVSMQQAASDVEAEGRLLYDLLQGNDVINNRK